MCVGGAKGAFLGQRESTNVLDLRAEVVSPDDLANNEWEFRRAERKRLAETDALVADGPHIVVPNIGDLLVPTEDK